MFNAQVAEETRQQIEDQFQIHNDEVVFGNTLFHNLGGGKFEPSVDDCRQCLDG